MEIEIFPIGGYSYIGKNMSAIILTHGHLDHIGAVNFIAPKYNVPIYASPYTIELIKQQEKEYGFQLILLILLIQFQNH
jgi:Predicted hydrolase of the metallo-beta-lactamase superfamily